MKKKIFLSILGLCFLIIIGLSFTVPSLAGKDKVHELMRKTGEIEKLAKSEESVTLLKGNTIIIDSKEVFALTEKNKLTNKEDAYDEALKYILEREALYLAAQKAGYSTTRNEAQQKVSEMKESFHQADNFDEFLAYLDGAQITEDDYWNEQVDIVAKEMTIAEFVKAQKQQLMSDPQLTSEKFTKRWEAKRASIIKEQLIADNVKALP